LPSHRDAIFVWGSESINLLVSYWTIGSENATVTVNLGLRMRMETVSERQKDVTEKESVVDKEKKVWSRIWKKWNIPCV
jgi:hypothetical protein